MMNEPISSIMTKDLITTSPESSIREAYNLLRNKRIHHLPVLEGRKLVGILTTYDIFKMEIAPTDYKDYQVGEYMTTKLATLGPNDKISSAVLVFTENLFHAVPIIDEDRNALGIITTLDVMKYSINKAYPDRFKAWGKSS